MSNKEAKQNGEITPRCSKCVSLTRELKSQENKRVDQFLFFKQKIMNFDKVVRTLLQQRSMVENECRALKAQVDHLWPCQQENEQLKDAKREIDERVVHLRTELDSKETTIFQLDAKYMEAEREKMEMLSQLDVYKVAFRDEKKKNERLQQKLNKSKELSQDKRRLTKLLKESSHKQTNAEDKLQNIKMELSVVKKESKQAEREWKSQYKQKLKLRFQSSTLSDLDSSTIQTPRRKRRRLNPLPTTSTPSNIVPQPSDSSQFSSDSDMSDVSLVSSIRSVSICQSLEAAIQWTIPAMSPLRTHTPNDAPDISIPMAGSPLPNLSPLHSPPPAALNPLNEDLHLSSSSQSNSSSDSDSSPLHTPPLGQRLQRRFFKPRSHSDPSLSPLSPSSRPSCSSRVTRSIARQLNISIPALQENTPDPPKVTRQHSRSRTTSENANSDLTSPPCVQSNDVIATDLEAIGMLTESACSSEANSVAQGSFEILCNDTAQLDRVQAHQGSYPLENSESLQAVDTSISIISPTDTDASLALMDTSSLPNELTGEPQLIVSISEPTEIDLLSKEPVQAFSPCYPDNSQLSVISTGAVEALSPCYPDNSQLSVISTGAVEALSQSTDSDPAEAIRTPTTRSRAKLASRIQSDLVSTQNKQLSPIASLDNQLSPIASLDKQLSPIASLDKQLSPIASPDNQLSPIASLDNQLSPIASLDKQLSPIASLDKQLSPIASPDNQLSPIASPDNQLSPIASLDKQLSPIASRDKQLSPIASIDKQLSPIASIDNQLSPIASLDKQLEPIASPDKQLEPIASPDNQLSPIASLDKQLSPIASPDNQLSSFVAQTKQLSPTVSQAKQLLPIAFPDKLMLPIALSSKQLSTPRRSPRLATTPDTISPVETGVFHLPAARPALLPSLPSQHNSNIGMPTKIATRSRHPVSAAAERQRMPGALIPVRKITSINSTATHDTAPARNKPSKRKSKNRKSKTHCLHSLERDRKSKPVHTSLSTERRVLELPKLLPKGSRQLAKSPPSSSKILSEYLRETSRPRHPTAGKEFSQMRTKKVSNLLALSEDQQELGRALSAGETGEEGEGRGVRVSEGESDVEMGMGPVKRVVGRGRQRRRIKSKVYISESEEYSSDSRPPPPEDTTDTEIGLREETVPADCIGCDSINSNCVSSVGDSSQLSRVGDTAVCLEAEKMRTLFSIPVTRARSRLTRPVYSLDSLGFYNVTPALSTCDIIRVKQEFSTARCYEGMGAVPDCEVVDLTETELSPQSALLSPGVPSQPSEEDPYMSPVASPTAASSCSSFNTPCSDDTKRHPMSSPSSPLLHSDQPALPTDTPAVSVPVNLRTTRSGNEYRSYLTTDFSNEESSLPFANFLSQSVPPTDSPQQLDNATSSELTGDILMDCSSPIVPPEQTYTGLTDSATQAVACTDNYWKRFKAESTTITELMSSSTFSSQSTSELFQANKSKFQAQSSKQTQRANQPRNNKGKTFPAKRGYVVGQGGTQDTDSDEEIDCMLQELRKRKETARRKPERPKTVTKKIVVIGVLKRNEEQSPYAYVVKTLERLRLGSLKVQDIMLMLKNPENIHNSLPIIQGIIKFLQMLPVAVEGTISQLIKHVCYFTIKKNKCYTPPDKLTQIGIPEEEPLMMKCMEDCWLDLTYWTRHSSFEREVISPVSPSYPPILAPFEAQLIFLILECNKAPHLGERTKYPLLQTLIHCLESILFGIKPNIPKITAIYTYSRLTSACRILTTIYRLQDNSDKMGFFFMALPLQRLDFSVADILLYQSMGVVWPKVLRRLSDQIVQRENDKGYKVMSRQVFLSTMQVIFSSILYSDYTLQVYYPCFTTLELICNWAKPNLYWPEDTMSCFTEELLNLLITSPDVKLVNCGPKKELSPVAHKIAVSLQTIAKVKDSQWVHKCLVHKLLMPAFADWACQKGIEEDLGLTSYIDTGSCRVISNPVAMCIISVFGYLKKLRFIRDERQPVKQQSLLINILYTSIKSLKVPLPVQLSCADALLDTLQIKSPQDRDITRCLTIWYKNLEKSQTPDDPLVQSYNSKLQTILV